MALFQSGNARSKSKNEIFPGTLAHMKSVRIFTVLVIYILLQFVWWSYLLISLNNETYEHRIEIVELKYPEDDAAAEKVKLTAKLHSRYLMIVGEGVVFLLLLSWVAYQTVRSIRKEMELARMQKNFLLSITHEFKSPLASIKLYLQTIQKHQLDKEKAQSFIAKAIADTERLDTLVENTLLANMIDHKGYSFNKEPVNFSALVRLVVQKYNSLPDYHQRILAKIDDDISIYADKLALTLLLNNLIENALKYSPPDTDIAVDLKKEGDHMVLYVADQGRGIVPGEREKIFRKFYRTGNEETRNAKGTGLGLFLAQHIARNHNGEISVSDNQPKGSVFKVTFKNHI
jgi:two-component system, OmpR family, phosphate regulon sensor histidine kinase PhoR